METNPEPNFILEFIKNNPVPDALILLGGVVAGVTFLLLQAHQGAKVLKDQSPASLIPDRR